MTVGVYKLLLNRFVFMDSNPLLSVVCNTFNHELYVRDAIEGFLMQKTNFKIEILIHDDASIDKTSDIIREYEKKYPDIIKPLYQTENQYSKGKKILYNYQLPRCKSKYIALCEGDDYWTDPLKLQKQIDFLEANPDYSLCFHNADIIFNNDKNKTKTFCRLSKSTYTYEDIILEKWFIPTQSIVFRNDLLQLPYWFNIILNGDYALLLLLSSQGNIHFINQKMSVYRRHSTSINTTLKPTYVTMKISEVLFYFNMYSNFKYNNLIQKRIYLQIDDFSIKLLNDFRNRLFFRKLIKAIYSFFKKWK